MNATQRKVLLDRGFLVGAQIGRGTFGTVFQCTDIKCHVTYALKAMDLRTLRMRSEFQESRLLREVQVMRKLHHPFIVRLHDVVFTEDALFLIMELVIGVDLFDTIVAKGGFDELGARFIFYQLCAALDYIHEQGILHRDIKPENILLRGPAPLNGSGSVDMIGCIPSRTWIKLVDFGLSKLQTSGDVNSFVGTPRYIAPEVITVGEEEKRRRSGVKISQVDGGGSSSEDSSSHVPSPPPSNVPQTTMIPSYSTPADCFSAGICLFVMMANCFPKFQEGIILFEGNNGRAAQLSPEAKDLILKLTNPDPYQRFSMKQALAHPWLIQARPWVEDLVRSETSIVSISKNPSFSYASAAAAVAGRPNKRPFIVSSPHHGHHHQSFPTVMMNSDGWLPNAGGGGGNGNAPTSNSSSGFASMMTPTNGTTTTHALGPWNPQTFGHQQQPQFPPVSTSSTSVPQVPSSSSTTTTSLVPEIERELWFAQECSPQVCSAAEVRAAFRATKNMLVLSERVVLKCTQTGMSVVDLIPDIRAALMMADDNSDKQQQQGMFDYVRQMLVMARSWIDQLKLETKETLQHNHQVLLVMGQIVQQTSLSPDVIAESVASLSMNNTNQRAPTPSLDCLKHLERVEQLLRIHESFWGRMDTVLNVLQQRATIIEGLTGVVLHNKQMAERFVQKLDEYFNLWRSAALMCQQFQQYNPNNNITPGPANAAQPLSQNGGPTTSAASSTAPYVGGGAIHSHHQANGGVVGTPPNPTRMDGNSTAGPGFYPSQPGSNMFLPASTVVVTNETSPASSLESYEGDI